jgi:hypothetical protein
MPWTIELFQDDDGRQPVREWIMRLDSAQRASVIAAIETLLEEFGLDICSTEHGKHLGQGLFELRIRHEANVLRRRNQADDARRSSGGRREILLRVFCHAFGEKAILLLGGYDKGAASSQRRQQHEIELARKRLRAFKLREQRRRTGEKRRR